MVHASATARKRLAADERFLGTDLPGCTGVLHPWGRQLQDHPHLHSIVPGGGLSKDRTTWQPSRANFFVPVKALSPLYRALFKEDMHHAGLLEQSDPHVWTLPWHGHSQAKHHGHSACPSLAPSVFRVALSNRRLVGLTDRTVTFTSRNVGSARPRTPHLDAIELIRRFLQHGLPDGCMKVRHVGLLHASCAGPLATIRRLMGQAHPSEDQPPPRPPHPRARPAVRPVAPRCASSGVYGPHTATLLIPAERQDVVLTRFVRHGVAHQRHPCARSPP
jgi:hypothetical protein